MSIAPAALQTALYDGGEIALLDVREEGQFGMGHILHAVPQPYSILERGLGDLVPRLATRVVLVDDGDGVAEKAASRMAAIGYANVSILAGGMPAWAAAGLEVFQGVNVPSKAFGEVVEVANHTPAIPPEELAAMQARGDKLVILDGRTPEEFNRMSIPGAVSVPNAELVYRLHELAPDADTTVIVNCAGRTRSIIGAQALRNADVPHKVAALKGGTMGWRLAGLTLDHGAEPVMPEVSDAGREKAVAIAAQVAERYGVPTVTPETAAVWRSEADRTTYLLDVRTPEEFAAGKIEGATNIDFRADDFATKLGKLDKTKTYLVHCRSGGRSTESLKAFKELGFTSVIHLDGGMIAWEKAGGAVVKP